jgi:N-acetylglucosamine-6-phosphate deacetylase
MPPSGKRLLIENARLHLPTLEAENGWLLVEGARIAALGFGAPPAFDLDAPLRRFDARGANLLPGFIDLHVHGAVGREVMDADPAGVHEMARFYARHGVTSFLATTWTDTRPRITAALRTVAGLVGRIPGGATLLGAHLEGPYLNPERCGAQEATLIRRAEREEALEFLMTGAVRLVSLAPEFPENLWFLDECVRRGAAVSAAHTAASYEQMQLAASRGLTHITHCFNAMPSLGHRTLGPVAAALTLPQINCELIADNVHVHPVAQKILMDVRGISHTILVTDAIRGAGLPDGEYTLDHRTVTIYEGQVMLPGGVIAGSVLTMETALKNALQASGRTLEQAWPISSLNAAREIGVSARKGSLEVGKDADLVLLDEDFQALLTIAEGELLYSHLEA